MPCAKAFVADVKDAIAITIKLSFFNVFSKKRLEVGQDMPEMPFAISRSHRQGIAIVHQLLNAVYLMLKPAHSDVKH